MSAKESKWAREASHTEPGSPVWPGLCRVQVSSDQIRFESESALHGEAGLATVLAAAGRLGHDEVGRIDQGQRFGVGKGHAPSIRPGRGSAFDRVADRDQVAGQEDERRAIDSLYAAGR